MLSIDLYMNVTREVHSKFKEFFGFKVDKHFKRHWTRCWRIVIVHNLSQTLNGAKRALNLLKNDGIWNFFTVHPHENALNNSIIWFFELLFVMIFGTDSVVIPVPVKSEYLILACYNKTKQCPTREPNSVTRTDWILKRKFIKKANN